MAWPIYAGTGLGILGGASKNRQQAKLIKQQNENIRRQNAALAANTELQLSAANMNLTNAKSSFTGASLLIAGKRREAEGAIAVSGVRGSGADRASRTAAMAESSMKNQNDLSLASASTQHERTLKGLSNTLRFGVRSEIPKLSGSDRLSSLLMGGMQGGFNTFMAMGGTR